MKRRIVKLIQPAFGTIPALQLLTPDRPSAGVPLAVPASEGRGNNLKCFKDFHLKAKSKIWP